MDVNWICGFLNPYLLLSGLFDLSTEDILFSTFANMNCSLLSMQKVYERFKKVLKVINFPSCRQVLGGTMHMGLENTTSSVEGEA